MTIVAFAMIYEKLRRGDGYWCCPFPQEWVEMMARAAKKCAVFTAEEEESLADQLDFLGEPQDARGLPYWYCRQEEERYKNNPNCCTSIYDYDSIPEVIVTNGHDDWPLDLWGSLLQA